MSFEGKFSQAPLWMQSGWVATAAFSFWGLLGTWFTEGRKLGFWRTIWRGCVEQCTVRFYSPGSPWGEEIPDFRSWLQPYGDLNEKQSQLFGNARVASIEEMKKGGLL